MDILKQTFLFVLLLLPLSVVGKPMPPIQLVWLTPDVGLANEVTRVRAQLTVTEDLKAVKVALELPPGISLLEGDAVWQGAVTAGEKKVFEFVLARQSVVQGQVHLHAELVGSHGDYHAHAIFAVGASSRGKAIVGGETQWRDGRQLKAFVLP